MALADRGPGAGSDRRLGISRPSGSRRIPEHLAILRFGWLRWQLRFLGFATLLLALRRVLAAVRPIPAVAGVAVAILAELLLLYRPANPPMPRQMPLPVNGPIAFLQWKLGQIPSAAPATGWRRSAGTSRPTSRRSMG